MTEYIVITGLVAIAAIGVFMLFGSSVRLQTGAISAELAGDSSTAQTAKTNLKQVTDEIKQITDQRASLGDAPPGVPHPSSNQTHTANGSNNSNANSADSHNGNSAANSNVSINSTGTSSNTANSGSAISSSTNNQNATSSNSSTNSIHAANGGNNAQANANSSTNQLLNNFLSAIQSGGDYLNALNGNNATGSADNGKDLGLAQCSVEAGNPINSATGLKYQQEIDYYAASGLSFVRHYNSYNNDRAWQHNWQRRLQTEGKIVRATRQDGKVYTFRLQDNVWRSDADVNDRLQPLMNGQQLIGWSYFTSEQLTEYYNTHGQLLSVTDRNEQRTVLTYNNGLLSRITDAAGRSLFLHYDSLGRLGQLIDPANQVYHYQYDAHHNLSSITYPDKRTKTYHYEDGRFVHALTGITDENGQRFASWHYDQLGRAISSEHGKGIDKVQINYKRESSEITDARGKKHTRKFRQINGVHYSAGVDQPAGSGCGASSSDVQYDNQGNMVSHSDFNGNKTCLAYDLKRNLEIYRLEGVAANKSCPTNLAGYQPQAGSNERKISTRWHPAWRLPLEQAEPLRHSLFQYDERGNLTNVAIQATQDNNGAQGFAANSSGQAQNTRLRYHQTGKLAQIDGPRNDVNDVTYFDYDAQHNLIRIKNALGHTLTISNYDAHGRPTRMVDANGQIMQLQYDARGRLLSRRQQGLLSQFHYDAAGNLLQVTTPQGARFHYRYDNAHRLVQITDRAGNSIHYTLDAMGNRIKEEIRDSAQRTITLQKHAFDNLNRLWQDIDAFNQVKTYEYDQNGNVTQITHGTLAMQYQYDALNRITEQRDFAKQQTRLSYDGLNQLVQFSDPRKLITHFKMNGLGHNPRLSSPDTGITDTQFDAAGNLTSRITANGQQSLYRYDALNRLTHIQFPGETQQDITFSYDNGRVGKLTNMQDRSGHTRFQYTDTGQFASDTRQIGDMRYTTRYHYDEQDRLTGISYPSGRTIKYQLDEQGRVHSIISQQGKRHQVLVKQVQYFPFGDVQSVTFGDERQSYQRTLDLNGRISSYTLGEEQFRLNYDALSRITQIASTGGQQLHYDYDAMGHLTRYQYNNNLPYHFAYDVNGNRLQQRLGELSVLYRYAHNSNRLEHIHSENTASTAFSYTADGSTKRDPTRNNSYYYDARGRMTLASTAQGEIKFAVNGLGQRVRKISKHADIHYHYDKQGKLLAESSNKHTLQEYVYLGELLIAVVSGGQHYFVHNDHLNTPRRITDSRGQTVWQWDNHDPFGNNQPNVEKITFNLRFAGQYADRETGLNYNYFRDYDPTTARYTTSDPIGLKAGVNTYAYVSANPLNFSDPFGLEQWRYQALEDGYQDMHTMFQNITLPKWAMDFIIPPSGEGGGSCATRMSNAFNRAGYEIMNVAARNNPKQVVKDSQGKYYIMGAGNLARHININTRANRITDISTIHGKVGIIYFQNFHIDLFNGTQMVGNGEITDRYTQHTMYFMELDR